MEAIAKGTAAWIRKSLPLLGKTNKIPPFSYSFGNSDILFNSIKSGQSEAKHFEFLWPGTPMAERVLLKHWNLV